MKTLYDLEVFLDRNPEILFHLHFLPIQKQLHNSEITEINEEEKFVRYINNENVHCTILYNSWFILEACRKISAATTEIETEITEISKSNSNPNEYLKLISKKIGIILQKASVNQNHKSVLPFLTEFQRHFNKLKNFKDFSTGKDIVEPNSFNWYGKDSEENLVQIKKLYELLTKSPPLIDCQEQEFINAFTNQPVKSGINWLVTGRSKQISKSSLFYLIDLLVEKELLDFQNSEYNSKIQYVFRDQFGNALQNIRQSKLIRSGNPSCADRINEIIDELIISF